MKKHISKDSLTINENNFDATEDDVFVFPASFAQQRLWFLEQLEGGSATYNIPVALSLTGSLHVTALEQAVAEIVQRHEALRTTFLMVDGTPVQMIAPTLTITVPLTDLQSLPKSKQSDEVQRLATEEAQRPFDLVKGPLLRLTLLRLGQESHVLLITMHHIISDGWSIGILIQELSVLYQAFSQGNPSPLSELPIQYADFAHWQRQWLSGEVLQALLNYWQQQLASAPPLLELPTDRPRPPVQTFTGSTERFHLDQNLTQKLQVLSQKFGVSIFMTLLAAFVTLLGRYSGQEDIVVGSPIANRNRRETELLIGFFVNTLVLRTSLQGNPTFQQLLNRIKQVSLDAYAHQDLPFEQLVEALQPQRNLSHNPLFQAMFVLQNAPMGILELPGLKLTPLELENVTSKFDLTLSMEETEQGLVGSWEYNSDLFDATTIQRMSRHFPTMLEGIVANPEQRLSQLPLLSADERHQLLLEWNDTQADYPQDKCIHELFESQVERTPDAVAVVFEDQQLTYGELNARANQLAHYLLSLGVKPDLLVGICVERSVEMVVGLLGILKAGGAYVPVDPAYPQERLSYILNDSQIPVLLTQQTLVDRLSEHQVHVVCLDTDWGIIAQKSGENPASGVQVSNLAYVIYTSGSTGQPKGVEVTHKSATNFLNLMQQRPGLLQSDIFLAVTTISFDIAVLEIYLPLMVGAKVVLVSREVATDGKRLNQLLVSSGASVMQATPATWHLLLASGWESGKNFKVLCGGEALTTELANELLNRSTSLWNLYGPTETTVWSSIYQVEASQSRCGAKDTLVPIGTPIANTQIYILDRHLQPVPMGVAGELHIGGTGLARGYLNLPGLTSEKFIPNPFTNEPEARLYKTGDLVRYLPNGVIQYLGRIDHQVKIRGFRIELGEIEALLSQHPDVLQTVVIAREDVPGDKRLVAYLVPDQEQTPTVSDLHQFLKEKLPEYMIPSAFVLLESFPLTPNGKVDRRALLAPDIKLNLEASFLPPRNLLELQMTHIWETLLGAHPIGVQDNFFDLGGHSLLALRLMAQIQQQFGKSLPLATLFQGATIEYLTSILQKHSDPQPSSPLVALQPSGNLPPFFCIHPVGGNVFCYTHLARHLGFEQPFYSLQSPGLNGEREPHTCIEDMAAHYIEALQTIQPQGPYHLGGWSNGGVVAFEMAQQLHACGHEVALLALIDSYAPTAIDITEEIDEAILITSIASDLGGLFGKELVISVDELQNLETEEQLNHILEQAKMVNILPPEVGQKQMRHLLQVYKANIQAMSHYTPQPYSGPVTLFYASEQVTEVTEEQIIGWGKVAVGSIETHNIPGNHYTILRKPHVHILAEQLKTYFQQTGDK